MVKKFSDTESRAWTSFIKSQQILLEKVDQEFKKHGFPPLTWYDVLLELDKERTGRLRLNVLGQRILLSKYNVTRLVKRLEAAGLLRREICKMDSRGVYAVITTAGRKLRKKMWPVYYRVIKQYFLSNLDENELSILIDCMNKIRTNID